MNSMSNETNWNAGNAWTSAHVVVDPGHIDLEPLAEHTRKARRVRHELLITGAALTALLYAGLAILFG